MWSAATDKRQKRPGLRAPARARLPAAKNRLTSAEHVTIQPLIVRSRVHASPFNGQMQLRLRKCNCIYTGKNKL